MKTRAVSIIGAALFLFLNMENIESTFHQLFLQEIHRRLFDEGIPRLKKCLHLLKEDQLTFRPNENTVSVGNLVLHLCGNVRQWVLSGVGGQQDNRVRDREFTAYSSFDKMELIAQLDELQKEVEDCLHQVTVEDLIRPIRVQGFDETVLSALTHVVEHFSYHVGQATYITKMLQDVDTAYYGNVDLNQKG